MGTSVCNAIYMGMIRFQKPSYERRAWEGYYPLFLCYPFSSCYISSFSNSSSNCFLFPIFFSLFFPASDFFVFSSFACSRFSFLFFFFIYIFYHYHNHHWNWFFPLHSHCLLTPFSIHFVLFTLLIFLVTMRTSLILLSHPHF